MGKAKKFRNRGPRHDPVGLNGNAVAVNENSSSATKSELLIENVIEKLQSHDEEDKVTGAFLLADVFDGRTLEEVAKNRLVRIAGPLLVDVSPKVRNAVSGALRNLTANGGPEFCDILVEQDIMTSLCSLLQKYGNDWKPNSLDTSECDEDCGTFINAVNMLWNLCESNASALRCFNEAHILSLLVRCLDVSTFGIDIATAVAECLHTVTEENQDAVTKMQDFASGLQQFLISDNQDENAMLFKVLIAGVLININLGGVTAMDPSRLSLIMATLSSTLAFDHRQMLNQLTSQLEIDIQKLNPRQKKNKEDMDVEMEDEEEGLEEDSKKSKPRGKSLAAGERTADLLKKEQKLICNASGLLQAQLVSLEILANLCSGEDDAEGMDTDDSESEEMSESSFTEDSNCPESVPIEISPDVLEAIVSQRLVTKVWDKTILPAENVCEMINEHMGCEIISNRVNLLRRTAFLCLQNLIAVLDLEELGGCNDLYNMWLETTKLVFQKTKADDLSLLEAATSVMRAAVLRLAQAKATQFSSLNADDLQILLKGESQCKDPNVRANLIRIVGCIGQMLAPTSSPHLLVIGKFLLNVASRDPEVWLSAEALDCIFDVFGEDETDKAALDIDLVSKLRSLAAPLKSKVRMQRKSLGDHYPVVMTATSNLNRFIKYKSKRLVKFTSNGHI
ncbi:HEAT repeat-containing protein 3 [Frankliniella fusca]|uniref:HEAT repeat-containing protein 3 n=1 Tax=Frankliniella fusca TaxID=407009 RepID=A0AAE1H388_9NEOP|nr:HEAT repeat-containing protein 3 [Frankliniella fusca]